MSSTFATVARKSGNSLVVTIPYNLVKYYQIKNGSRLKITVQKVDDQEEG